MINHLPNTLMHTLSSNLDLSKSRLQTLAWLIIGLVNARTVNLSHIASQCAGDVQIKSSYRRLQRFFQYVSLEADLLAQIVVKLLRIQAPWVLCLDRTNWKIGRRDVNILMLAITTKRLRIPLMWTVLERAGPSNQEERIALMRRYLALFGPGSITFLLADREFIGANWIEFLLKNKVLFSIRVKEALVVRLEDGHREQLKTLLRRPEGLTLLQSQPARFEAMDESLGFPLHFAVKWLRDGEILIVSTNGHAGKALKIYRRRWQIECLFGDSKSRGLNMEDTRLSQPAKLNTLLFIITVSIAWSYACATAVKAKGSIKTLTHGYRYKSWFRLGFDQLRKWILYQPERAAEIWKRIWPKRKVTLQNARVV